MRVQNVGTQKSNDKQNFNAAYYKAGENIWNGVGKGGFQHIVNSLDKFDNILATKNNKATIHISAKSAEIKPIGEVEFFLKSSLDNMQITLTDNDAKAYKEICEEKQKNKAWKYANTNKRVKAAKAYLRDLLAPYIKLKNFEIAEGMPENMPKYRFIGGFE